MNTVTKLEMHDINALVPYAQNARTHSPEQVAQLRGSLREFGFVAPVLIDADGNIIAGHGRVLAAKAEGFAEVPCVLVEHLSDLQRKAYILADNRLAEAAGWDKELVSMELETLREAGFDVNLTGFSENDIILDEMSDLTEDDFEVQLPAEPKSKRGEIYQLGNHRLMCGDATSEADVNALMDGAIADLLLTDPPYNVNVTGGTGEHLKIENDNQSDVEFEAFLQKFLTFAVSVLAPGASFYIWHPDGEQGRAFRNALHAVGLAVRQCLIWVKNVAVLSRQDYHWQHEPCLHGEVEALELPETWNAHEACLYGWKDGKKHRWCSDRKQTTILEFDKPARNADHPTMKPVLLFAYQIQNSTLPGALIYDPFAGSGTTIIAAEKLGRSAYVMEYDPRYVDVIIARWEALTGEKAVLLSG